MATKANGTVHNLLYLFCCRCCCRRFFLSFFLIFSFLLIQVMTTTRAWIAINFMENAIFRLQFFHRRTSSQPQNSVDYHWRRRICHQKRMIKLYVMNHKWGNVLKVPSVNSVAHCSLWWFPFGSARNPYNFANFGSLHTVCAQVDPGDNDCRESFPYHVVRSTNSRFAPPAVTVERKTIEKERWETG